jgi:hypothetical protein
MQSREKKMLLRSSKRLLDLDADDWTILLFGLTVAIWSSLLLGFAVAVSEMVT